MQISRHLLLACAVATYLTPTWLHAYDNEAQIRARQALEEKMKQIDTQTTPTTSAPPAAVAKPAAPKKPKRAQHPTPPAETPTPPVAKSAPAERAAQTPPAQAPEISQPATPAPAAPAASANQAMNDKLREALHEKMGETQNTPAATAPAAPAAPAAPVVKTMPPAEPAPAAPANTAPAPAYVSPAAPAGSATDEKLREALREKMNQTQTGSTMPAPAAPSAPTANSAPPSGGAAYAPVPGTATNPTPNDKLQYALREKMKQTEEANSAMTRPPAAQPQQTAPAPSRARPSVQPAVSLPPLAGPPSSLSPAKQQKLDDLLQLYRADRLTPEQYHEERAKILSEP